MSATHNFLDWRVQDPRGGVPTDEIPQVTETHYTGGGADWKFDATFYTREEADAFTALFPKYAKVGTGTLGTHYGSGDDFTSVLLYTSGAQGKISADKVNGGINETGDKRRNAIEKVLKGLQV